MPKAWTRDELIVAFNLYCGLPFGQVHKGNPVIEIAEKLGRTPSSVAMKLVNFVWLDPYHAARGVKGLTGVSTADRKQLIQLVDPACVSSRVSGHFDNLSANQFKTAVRWKDARVLHPLEFLNGEEFLAHGFSGHA